ncbi:MAG TPA: M48 family metalloprotease [Cyclobacteriaceae bacterium]|nr:M48 family metalloprotease [Cyclobacteriaceae bacterium]
MKLFAFLFLTTTSFVALSQDYSVDKKMGADGKATVEATMGIYPDSAKTRIVSKIGKQLVSNLATQPFPFEFYIVDLGEPNAFALPGGYVFFTRGILALANSEDELAGVMGHEVIHSYNRHSIKQKKKAILPTILQVPEALTGALGGNGVSKIFSPLSKGGEALMASHSRKDEYEADDLGVKLSAKSGYQPEALGDMLTTLEKSIEVFTGEKEKPSYFNDHPYTPSRVDRIAKEAAQVQASTPNKVFKDNKDFLRALDGVLVGANPNQGVFKGDWFIHPELKFKIQIPATWARENTPSNIVAADTTQSAMMMLEVEAKAKTAAEGATAFAEAFKEKTGVTVDVKSDKINGLTSSRVSFVQHGNNKKITFTAAWIEYGGLIYRIVGGASPGFEATMTSQLESFSSITESERRSVTKRVIRVVETNKGETIKAVSDRNHSLINPRLTAAINGIKEETVFEQGDLLKIVVEVAY